MHCVWYWTTCTARLYYSHVSGSVMLSQRDGSGPSPLAADGITCAVESYVANLGELINIHLIALSSKRLHLNWRRSSGIPERYVSNTSRSLLYVVELSYFITWNLTLHILTEETVYCFCGNKPVHDCCCFELFYRLELDFLGLLERYVIICFCFFMYSNCGNDTFCIANSWLILKFDHGWIWLSLIDIILDILRCIF